MKRVVVRVDQVLQHIYIGVCVFVCEIPPHFTLQGGIEAFGQRAFNITVLSCKKCDASFFHKVLEMFVQECLFKRLDMRGTARPSRAPRKPPSCSRILSFYTIEVLGWVTPLSCVLYLASRWTACVSEMGRFLFITLIAT